MGRLELAVQVLNLSPKITLEEISTFFSYCGTVEKIQLQKTVEGSQSALITFKQPYAFQTALLLNEAILAGQPIRVLPSRDGSIPTDIHVSPIDEKSKTQQLIPAAQAAAKTVASKGAKLVNMTKDEFDGNYKKLLEMKQLLVDQTKSAMHTTITGTTDYISAGAMWVSGSLDKASKWVYALGNRKRDNPNSRKQK